MNADQSIWVIVAKVEGEDRYDDSEFYIESYHLTECEAKEKLEKIYKNVGPYWNNRSLFVHGTK